MKKFIPALFFTIFATALLAQPTEKINQEVQTETGEYILVGKLDRSAFEQDNYLYWFEPEYIEYVVSGDLDQLRNALANKEILLFIGTWCTDSQREVPRLYKILDAIDYDYSQMTVIGLDNHPDNYKKSPQHEEEGWNIEYVPTIIVLKNDQEIGRITERPQQTLEADLLQMCK